MEGQKDADELKKGAEEGKMEGNELTSPLKEDADEFKNEWKKDAEEGERDLDDAQKDANDRVCVACCCETTLHIFYTAIIFCTMFTSGALFNGELLPPLSQLNSSL